MAEHSIRFDDGAAYEQMMGIWSRSVGEVFLDWLASPSGLKWIDVGCGNGAFTELMVRRCAPSEVHGIDPSEGQLAYARSRPALSATTFVQGEAQELSFPDGRFDAAVMALVLVFVPEPAVGVREMARVTRPGGIVAAYTWDMLAGGFPLHTIFDEMRAAGLAPPRPSRVDICTWDAQRQLWSGAGLEAVETREITVSRTFLNFDEFWAINTKSPTIAPVLAGMTPDAVEALRAKLRARLQADAEGRITYEARAHAIKGRVPA